MSLKDSLQHERARGTRKGPDCTLCVALRLTITGDDLTELQEALADESMTGAAISRALKAEGHNVSPSVVLRHRRGECRA